MTVSMKDKWPVLGNWKFFITIGLPILLLPLIIVEDSDLLDEGTSHERPATKFKCAYVIILMAVFWMAELIPLAVTAFLPIVLFPILGVQDTSRVSINYMKETNMMFVGGLMIALSVEYCNLHKRIALKVMTTIGSSPMRIMLGIMMTTMFLSMFISNTATTAMMVPIVISIVEELHRDGDDSSSIDEKDIQIDNAIKYPKVFAQTIEDEEKSIGGNSFQKKEYEKSEKTVYMMMPQDDYDQIETEKNDELSESVSLRTKLSIAIYCTANIGGLFLPYTSVTSNVLYRLTERRNIGQDGKYTDLTFATWMAFNIPGMLINVFIAWIYLSFVFFGSSSWLGVGKQKNSSKSKKNQDNVGKLLKQKYEDLGEMSFHEICVVTLFTLVVCLWFFRDPRFIPGWATYLPHVHVGDSTAAMFVVLLLFIIPKDLSFFSGGSTEALLDWRYVQDHLPWGVVLLMGGGFALSDAADASGLSSWIGLQLNGLKDLDPKVMLIIILITTAMVTEIASNTAVANVIIPILLTLSERLKIHPLYLTLPATVTCSYAFMLPVATPPNAIVASAGKIKISDMIKTGAFLNFSCVVVLFLLNISYGEYLFGYQSYTYITPNSTLGISV